MMVFIPSYLRKFFIRGLQYSLRWRKTYRPIYGTPFDVELTFGPREARLGGDINKMRLLAFYNRVESLWLSDPINKNYYQPREQTNYPGADRSLRVLRALEQDHAHLKKKSRDARHISVA